jgi:hypothetical protein
MGTFQRDVLAHVMVSVAVLGYDNKECMLKVCKVLRVKSNELLCS